MVPLPNPFALDAYNASGAWNVNEAGQVMGLAVDDDGYSNLIRWDVAPIPGPSQCAMLLAGLGMLGLMVRVASASVIAGPGL